MLPLRTSGTVLRSWPDHWPGSTSIQTSKLLKQQAISPDKLQFEALEISCFTTDVAAREKFGISDNIAPIKNSEAHYPEDIGKGLTDIMLTEFSFNEIKLALFRHQNEFKMNHIIQS